MSKYNHPVVATIKRNIVEDKNPHPTSRASYVKLIQKLAKQDDFICMRFHFMRWVNFRNAFIAYFEFHLEKLFCGYCKKSLTTKTATIDHIQPVSKGGGIFDKSNMMICCHKCNQLKRDLRLDEFLDNQKWAVERF